MNYTIILAHAILLTTLTGCGLLSGDGGGSDDDGGGGCPDLIDDAVAGCDPTASAWDDLFYFEADTDDSVESVEVKVYVGSSRVGSVALFERGSGNWYGEEWADDLDADCDDWNSMYFEVEAEGDGCDESTTINP